MVSSHEAIKKQHAFGHNSGQIKEDIKDLAAEYAQADEESAKLNDKRAKIREKVADLGLDTKAWQHEISRVKRDLKKKEGYDESVVVIREAFGDLVMEDLFAHVARREREKEEARAKKAEPKAKTKGTKKSIGEQQAEAIQAAA